MSVRRSSRLMTVCAVALTAGVCISRGLLGWANPPDVYVDWR